uniref:Uncharacterized protein n=1 Tax=Gossypium raimondii TaxID=29730 RepID=A0A0D2RK33_GOSRA|nr:hypothetical protein B456_003G104800 [Gossypium raimondii]
MRITALQCIHQGIKRDSACQTHETPKQVHSKTFYVGYETPKWESFIELASENNRVYPHFCNSTAYNIVKFIGITCH